MQKKYELEDRTKKFAVAVIKFVSNMEITCVTKVLNYQLIKSGTSIGANYREANRAESTNDFIHKIGIVEKEASESDYWLEVFKGSKKLIFNEADTHTLTSLSNEVKELLAFFNSISRNSKKKF